MAAAADAVAGDDWRGWYSALPAPEERSAHCGQTVRVLSRRTGHGPASSGAVFEPGKVDLVSVTPDGGLVRLHIVSDWPWTGSDEQLNSLQAKIHNYVGFALDGHLTSSFPEAAGLPWQIVIDCQSGAPDQRTAEVLRQLAEAIRNYEGDLIVLHA